MTYKKGGFIANQKRKIDKLKKNLLKKENLLNDILVNIDDYKYQLRITDPYYAGLVYLADFTARETEAARMELLTAENILKTQIGKRQPIGN